MADAATANPNHLTQRLNTIVADFRAALYRHGHLHRAAMPLVALLLQYLTRAIARFAKTHQRGPIPPRPTPTQSDTTPAKPRPARTRKPNPFPTTFGWVLALLPPTPISGALAGGARAGLIALLATPELIEALNTNPSLGRILRPLCHIFGVKRPAPLKPHAPGATPPAPPTRAHPIAHPGDQHSTTLAPAMHPWPRHPGDFEFSA
ncbi:MAG: hypothetical protein POH28_13955 [Acidocella sp.]|nr:hypothetical protein [Acidocella sp.]